MTRVHDRDVYTYNVYMITLRDAHIYTYVYIYIWRIRLVCGARAYKWHQLVRLETHGLYQTRITLTANMHTCLNVVLSIRNVLDNIRRNMCKRICGAA
jgi:hypothetical protein